MPGISYRIPWSQLLRILADLQTHAKVNRLFQGERRGKVDPLGAMNPEKDGPRACQIFFSLEAPAPLCHQEATSAVPQKKHSQ